MRNKTQKIPPALKHGAYTATSVLPGESQLDFEKLHQGIIDDLGPSGPLEHDIIKTLARLVWRKQNLSTLALAESAKGIYRYAKQFCDPRFSPTALRDDAEGLLDQARSELGYCYEFTEIGNAASFNGLTEELAVRERLDSAIARCLKQLLLVRGVKSVSVGSPSLKQISNPSKAA